MLSPDRVPADATSPRLGAASQRRLLWLALAVLAISAATILGALGFEHIGGYLPCALCLMQRTPYYVGVPVAAAAAVAILLGAPRGLVAVLFGAFALVMLYGGGLAVYHSGVEWGLWAGPASCSPSVGVTSAADMLSQIEGTHAPSCTDAPWRLLGLSFAGWNVLASALLVALGIGGARTAWNESRRA
jgi:disulfide bond formation protein DsbB